MRVDQAGVAAAVGSGTLVSATLELYLQTNANNCVLPASVQSSIFPVQRSVATEAAEAERRIRGVRGG